MKSMSPFTPWLVTLSNRKVVQVTQMLCFGSSRDRAIAHISQVASLSDWEVVDIMRISNRRFVCNADYHFPAILFTPIPKGGAE